jgi:hypothetical protein
MDNSPITFKTTQFSLRNPSQKTSLLKGLHKATAHNQKLGIISEIVMFSFESITIQLEIKCITAQAGPLVA